MKVCLFRVMFKLETYVQWGMGTKAYYKCIMIAGTVKELSMKYIFLLIFAMLNDYGSQL